MDNDTKQLLENFLDSYILFYTSIAFYNLITFDNIPDRYTQI